MWSCLDGGYDMVIRRFCSFVVLSLLLSGGRFCGRIWSGLCWRVIVVWLLCRMMVGL